MSKSKVLILSSLDDIHVNFVSTRLTDLGCDFDLFRFDDFITNSSFTFRPGDCEKDVLVLGGTGKQIDLRRYSFIWHRRPGNFKVKPLIQPWMDLMVQREGQAALLGTFFSLDCNWMNFPSNDNNSLHKLWQLELASRLGLSIPETLITNRPDDVLKFYDHCDGQVIYKMISESSNFAIPRSERPAGISTMPLRKKDLAFIDQVALAPHCFQKKIDKAYDLRVTVVGQRIFSIKIESQTGKGKIDWRHDYTVPMIAYELENHLSEKCLQLTKELGLNYGAIDLVRATTGEYFFLEINSAGQFLWAEDRTKLPISQAVAAVLAGVEPPLTKQNVSARHHLTNTIGNSTK